MMPRASLIAAAFWAAFLMPASAHDIYTSWRNPTNGMSCCNAVDCYPTEAEFTDGHWIAQRREDHKWLPIPDGVVLKDGATPDGKAHLCAPAPITEEDNRIYCFRPPWSGG